MKLPLTSPQAGTCNGLASVDRTSGRSETCSSMRKKSSNLELNHHIVKKRQEKNVLPEEESSNSSTTFIAAAYLRFLLG
nr:unnamed protein product [Naegleria fowleri]